MSRDTAPGASLTLDIEKPAAGGRMLARHDGLVVLVWGAIPGERVKARVERLGKGVAYAETTDVLTASTDRRRVAGDWRCGGNVLAHVAYARQLQLKGQIIQDAFVRIARVPLADTPPVTASPETGYRMRARLHAHDGLLGFYREGTHQLCDAAATGQLSPQTNAWIAAAQERLQRAGLAGIAAIELAENMTVSERACHLELHAGAAAAPYATLAEGLTGLSAQRADRPGVELLAGTPAITDTVRITLRSARVRLQPDQTLRLRRDVRAFFQGNRFLLETLIEDVAGLVPAGPVVDLYAGVGLFGLSLAAAGADAVTVVEGDPIGGADLQWNAEPFGGRVRVERRSVETFLRSRRGGASADATFVVDPPRTGMSKEALAGIVHAAPGTIVYVSCDVATLARDSRTLIDGGYSLGPVAGVDLFPNTAHVETVALFTRDRS